MRCTQHPSNNQVLAPPEGAAPGEVTPLPVTKTIIDGRPFIVSFWMPDSEELSALLAGRPVILYVMGDMHPPVFLTAEAKHAPTGG